jgi:protein TonB
MQSVKDITFESIETNPHIELHIQPSPEDLLIYQLPAPQKISCLPSVYLRGPCSVKKWHKRLPASKNNIRPPVALKGNPLPVYPYLARINNYEGLVILKVSVSPEGRCVNVTVVKSSGYKILDKAAVEAVEKWRFVPSQKNGKPVYGEKEIKIRFKLI